MLYALFMLLCFYALFYAYSLQPAAYRLSTCAKLVYIKILLILSRFY